MGTSRAGESRLRSTDELTDEELVRLYHSAQTSNGSRQLIDELIRRHQARVISWCYRLTRDRDLARDLAQDVFVKAYSSLETFRRESKFTTWLYVITCNRCRDDQRARAVRARQALEDSMSDAHHDWNGGLAALDARDARAILRPLMDEVLDRTERLVMTMHYGHDVPLDTITAALGFTNTSGAKAYIVSARRKLKMAMRRWTAKS